MIRYSLACVGEHAFEAWFSNSAAYDTQRKKGQVECPVCGSTKVRKQIMAPAISLSAKTKSAGVQVMDEEAVAARMAGKIRDHIATTYTYVGEKFADEARAMHSGEAEEKPLWGEVTPDVARELAAEGVPAMPLPKAFAPPAPRQKGKLN